MLNLTEVVYLPLLEDEDMKTEEEVFLRWCRSSRQLRCDDDADAIFILILIYTLSLSSLAVSRAFSTQSAIVQSQSSARVPGVMTSPASVTSGSFYKLLVGRRNSLRLKTAK